MRDWKAEEGATAALGLGGRRSVGCVGGEIFCMGGEILSGATTIGGGATQRWQSIRGSSPESVGKKLG